MEPRVFDLDQAAQEAGIIPLIVKFAGREWSCPPVLPLEAIRAAQELAEIENEAEQSARAMEVFDNLVTALFGDAAEDFRRTGYGAEHLGILVNLAYKVDLGESLASQPSLNRAGRRSNATSKGSTKSTSVKRAAANGS